MRVSTVRGMSRVEIRVSDFARLKPWKTITAAAAVAHTQTHLNILLLAFENKNKTFRTYTLFQTKTLFKPTITKKRKFLKT